MRRRSGKSAMKARGSTPELSSILSDLSEVKAGGMGGVAVKGIDTVLNPDCEGSWLYLY